MKRMLVITRAPWLNDNGIGRTLSDFFCDFSGFEIYSLCLREAPYICSIPKKNFYISENQLIKGLLKRGQVGKITESHNNIKDKTNEEKMYSISKRLNLTILSFIRELLWSTNIWKNHNLDEFLDEAKPDIVFFPDFPCVYAHKVLNYIHRKTNARIAIFHADDCYTLKQFSLSPLFWLYRFYLRKWVRKSVAISDLHYVISDVQKKDYDECFHVNNKILTKFSDFTQPPNIKTVFSSPLQLVYTGNIGLNRWKSLAIIARALQKINENGVRAQLRIYTANEISKRIRKELDILDSSFIMGKKSPDEIEKIQADADILVHVESMDLKNRLLVRQSFSTKIVDYLKSGRAILAIGPQDVASIKHLNDNDCALVAESEEEVIRLINKVLTSTQILSQIAKNGYDCGKRNHNQHNMISMIQLDIIGCVEDGNN